MGPVWAFVPLSLWGFLLVALLWIDLEFRILPDALTLPGTVLGVAAALLALGWVPGARHALLGIAAGSGVLWFLAWAWITFRKVEGMGMGDVKLAAMFGAVLGWQLTLLTLFVAALAGSLWGGALMLRAPRRHAHRAALRHPARPGRAGRVPVGPGLGERLRRDPDRALIRPRAPAARPRTLAPCGCARSARAAPPCRCTISRTIARPSPEPPELRTASAR